MDSMDLTGTIPALRWGQDSISLIPVVGIFTWPDQMLRVISGSRSRAQPNHGALEIRRFSCSFAAGYQYAPNSPKGGRPSQEHGRHRGDPSPRAAIPDDQEEDARD